MIKNLRLLLAVASIAVSSLSAHALIATEAFAYTAAQQLSGLNGGSGWSGAWTGSSTATIQSPSLDFPGRTETGNKAVLGNSNSTYTLFRSLASTVSGSTASTASLSFLFNLTGNDADTGIRFAGLSLFTGTTELIFFGKPGNTTEIGIEKYAGGTEVLGVDTSFSSSTVFLFEADFVLNTIGNSFVTVKVSDNSNSGTLLSTWSNLSLGSGFEFNQIRLIRDFALDSGINPEFDEISISAIPEPSAVALLAVAAVIGLARRRRAPRRG